MSTDRDVERLVVDLRGLLESARWGNIQGPDFRRVLRFIDKVATVVDQAFRDVILVLNQFQDLDQILANPPRFLALRSDVRDLSSRDRFAHAEQICVRLKSLEKAYREEIEPLIPSPIKGQWSSLFQLLNEHEGRIIELVHRLIWNIESSLEDPSLVPGSPKVHNLRRQAREEAEVIRASLRRLDQLAADILALSGADGISILTETERYDIARQVVARSAWVSGSFYLVVGLSITSLLLFVARTAPWYTTPLVVIGGVLFTTLIGALQLRQDGHLSEEKFGQLIELAFKQLPLVRLVARRPKGD